MSDVLQVTRTYNPLVIAGKFYQATLPKFLEYKNYGHLHTWTSTNKMLPKQGEVRDSGNHEWQGAYAIADPANCAFREAHLLHCCPTPMPHPHTMLCFNLMLRAGGRVKTTYLLEGQPISSSPSSHPRSSAPKTFAPPCLMVGL